MNMTCWMDYDEMISKYPNNSIHHIKDKQYKVVDYYVITYSNSLFLPGIILEEVFND